jgi:uncharacterized protein (TIGR03435 family)
MKRRSQIIGDKVKFLGLFNRVSPEEMESARAQALKYLESTHDETIEDEIWNVRPVRAARRKQWLAAVAAAAAIAIAVVLPTRIVQSAPALLEDANGTRRIQYGEIVRPSGGASAILSMPDGPRVELRSESELSLERTDDGTRIHLNKGGVIVDATAQHSGNVSVQTKDLMASVSGAVSLVKTEEQGSRVATISGEVRVPQDLTLMRLRPGEQIATNPEVKSLPVIEQVAWSRQAEAHVARLQQSQQAVPPKSQLAFEVVSIRPSGPAAPSAPGARGGGGDANSRPTKEGCSFTSMGYTEQLDPRRFAVTRVTLFHLIAWAYTVPTEPSRYPTTRTCGLASSLGLISGGPDWIKTDMWDIQASIPEGLFANKPTLFEPKLQQMLQTLLEERSELVIRRETRDLPVYLLKVGKNGTRFNGHGENYQRMMILDSDGKIRPASELPPPPDGGFSIIGNRFFDAQNVSMKNFADNLFGIDGRPVLDRTGLAGRYDFHFYRDGPTPISSPTDLGNALTNLKSDAVRAMGLELEESQMSFEVWVIERAEKPSEN